MEQKKATVKINLPPRQTLAYESWIRGKSKGDIVECLERDFADILDNPIEHRASIIVGLHNNLVVGVPYSISNDKLRMGPFTRHDTAQIPGEMYIPLESILAYQRVELPKSLNLGGFGYHHFYRASQLVDTKNAS